MPYVPSSVVTSEELVDNAGGAVSRTIDAAHATIWDEAAEEKERSSLADAYNELRAIVTAAIGSRGGGYRPVTPPAKLTTSLATTGATIPATLGVYDRDNEDEYRGNMTAMISKLIDDLTLAKGLTGPRGTSWNTITDSSGGTPSSGVGAAGLSYNGNADNNVRATFADKLVEVATACGVTA